MATRKQREILRLRRIEFDKTVEANRKMAEEKGEEKPKKRGRPPKKKVSE